MIIDDVDAKYDASIWDIYYQMRIDRTSDDLLRTQAKKLVASSATIDTWKQSKYSSQLKFCDTATLADARMTWLFYSNSREKADTAIINKRLDTVVDTATRMKQSRGDGIVTTGWRSAAPAHAHARSVMDMDALYKRFWKQGTVDTTDEASAKANLPNLMFLTVDSTSSLHYGADPLLGFHLATAYTPLEPQSELYIPEKESGQLQKVVDAARLEFRQWSASFRRRAGSFTLRFFVGDAIAFAHTLQNAHASGSPTAGLYRNKYQLEPLTLMESDYGATGSAPLRFDIVDTSNLCDHVGPLNLLTAVSPLLLNNLASTLYTEVIPKATKSRKEVLDTMLCGDTPTVSTLIGLFPAEYWTNASCVPYGDEGFLDAIGDVQDPGQPSDTSHQGQMFLRVAWKRPPCLASSADTSDLSLIPIRFSKEDLAQVLYRIYLRMFDDEDWTKKFADLGLNASAPSQRHLNPQPQYHRGGLAAFLRLVQRRVICDDWDKTMALFLDLVDQGTKASMGMHCFQELCAYLHIFGAHTASVFNSRNLVSGMSITPQASGGQHLRAWTNIAPVICITLKVPRKYLKAFTEEDPLSYGVPAVYCRVANGGSWENFFPACQFTFGDASTTGVRHSDGFEVYVTEDKDGWAGSSALIVTFYTPSWAILQDYSSATVSFGLYSTPLMLSRFMKYYGPTLTIYETAMDNAENVCITKYAPHQQAFPTVSGFTVDQLAGPGNIEGASIQTLTAGGHPQTGCLVTMIGRLDIGCETHRAALKDGASVTIENPTPCHSTVTLGQMQPLDIFFPVPVLRTDQKIRIARKSSYVEIIAQVAKVSNSAEFPTSFWHPLYLTGNKKVPLAWSMPHLHLEKQPPLDLRQVSKLGWLNTHLSLQWSNRERRMRDNASLPRSPGEGARLDLKESLYGLLVQFAGLHGHKSAAIFGISIPGKEDGSILIFPHKLRIDLATRSVVLDCAVLPLHAGIMPKLTRFLRGLGNGAVQIKVDEAELRVWKQTLPSWVERCRADWGHGDGCEYRAAGRIPLSDRHGDDEQPLCSCGQGIFPGGFTLPKVPGWLSMARKYSTRAAISPVFWAPFADEAYVAPTGDQGTPRLFCKVCGAKQKKDGKPLMKCGGCRLVQYCSVECQKKDWKTHKTLCSASRT